MMPTHGQSNGSAGLRVIRPRSPGFTLMEMLVAVGLLLVMMGLASQVFKIALDGTGRLTQLSEVDRSVRMFEDQLRREAATIDPTRSILAIQANPSPAYWTEEQKLRDDDGNILNGIGDQQFTIDPLRENPTLGYDPLDGDGDLSFDGDDDRMENVIPQLPRADKLMFIAKLPDERSRIDDSIKSDGPVMIVYNHAELGTLRGSESRVFIDVNCPPGVSSGICGDNDSTDDWAGGLSLIPVLQNGGGMDPLPDAQDIARDWHLARRAVLLKETFDSKESLPAGQAFDRYAHVLSPSDPADNRFAGFLTNGNVGNIDSATEAHYLNWILGGEMDVVSPISPLGTLVSGRLFAMHGSNDQDFVYEYEVVNRYFGGQFTLDALVDVVNNTTGLPPGDGLTDRPSVINARGSYRGAVPAWWLARSHLDLEPPPALRHRLAHYFMSNCASFKVEWTPNDIRLEQAGLPEVVWIDPFKEPGNTRLGASAGVGPVDPITQTGVQKPLHLDEFEIMAQKMAPESGVTLASSSTLGGPGSGSAFDPSGSLLYQVQQSLMPRFGLSIPTAFGGVAPVQSNVFDADPTTLGVQPSYNTHSWYAKDLEIFGGQPKTSTGSDPMWPKALRITVDLFDDAGKLEQPVRHTFIVPIGSKSDGNNG